MTVEIEQIELEEDREVPSVLKDIAYSLLKRVYVMMLEDTRYLRPEIQIALIHRVISSLFITFVTDRARLAIPNFNLDLFLEDFMRDAKESIIDSISKIESTKQ